MSRALPEWIGRTPDTPAPPRVRLRVLLRFGRKCDAARYGCGRAIRPGDDWICDHIEAIINGGENRERNLHPLCAWCNPKKNESDAAIKSKTYARASRHVGIRRAKQPFRGWRTMRGEAKFNPKLARER